MATSAKRIVVLGSTGSVGTSALEVAAALPDRVQLAGLVAHTNWPLLARQCHAFGVAAAVLTDADAFARADRAAFPACTHLTHGPDAVAKLVQADGVDMVLAAIVGVAGLAGTVAALEAGKDVALANKEALVVGGAHVVGLAARTGSRILPVDSEHSAIFQALTGSTAKDVTRVVLTASGGPFRGRRADELERVTPAEALKHPTWTMGPKISVDSATLMNKALEVIEARWLFGLAAEQIDVVVHPESVVHSFVEFVDGSVLAQLSPPDMKLPIQLAFTHPERVPGPAARLDWAKLSVLRFEPPDRAAFPALDLGFEVVRRGGSCGVVLNAANEAAVARFLAGTMGFADIARCCRAVLDWHDYDPNPTLDGLLAFDRRARLEVQRWTPNRP